MSDEHFYYMLARKKDAELDDAISTARRYRKESRDKDAKIAALTREREEARKHEAVCHCGINYSSHKGWDGHSFVEMKEPCPFQAENAELRGRIEKAITYAELVIKTPSNHSGPVPVAEHFKQILKGGK